MELGLEKKVAVVTGASDGIGKAIALALGHEKTKVAICSRDAEHLHAAAAELKQKTGAEVLAVSSDMTAKEDVKLMIGEVVRKWQTVDILVNNVGCATKASFEALTEDDWQRSMDANLFSSVLCTRQVLPLMRKRQWGRIINIAAVSGKEPSLYLMASNAAKAALLSFSKTLAAEVAADHVLVNAVCPGRILSRQILRLFSKDERRQISRESIPLKRFGTPEELADLVVFLASERASYITGTAIAVDGGLSKGLF